MIEISIIVAFRNREEKRVFHFLESLKYQTLKNFELIFINTGSDIVLSDSIEKIVSKYDFAKYIYHDTRGKEWNKCEALNIGVHYSNGDYLHFTDIDLIYSPNFISEIYSKKNIQKQIYSRVYMVNENFIEYEKIFLKKPSEISVLSHTSGKGILFVHRTKIESIGGYDTFYSDWGIEDNDIYIRLLNFGLEEEWMDHQLCPVFHQWHQSNEDFNRYPDKWLDDMTFYSIINQTNYKRNNNFVAVVPVNSRILLKNIEAKNFDTIEVESTGYSYTKTLYFRKIWLQLTGDHKHCFLVKVPIFKVPKISFVQRILYHFILRLFKIARSPYRVSYFQVIERNNYFLPEKDIEWFLRKCLKNTNTVSDYFITKDENYTYFYIEPKK